MKAITFTVGSEHYAINISYLKEVKPFSELKNTYVPHSPRWLKGLVNLRGSLVPSIHFGKSLGIAKAKDTDCKILILTINNRLLGLIVDTISTIQEISEGHIEKTPSTMSAEEVAYVTGVTRLEKSLLLHISPEAFISRLKHVPVVPEDDGRKHERKDFNVSALVAAYKEDDIDIKWTTCKVIDVSKGGVKMASGAHLPVGAGVKIQFQGGAILHGLIVWSAKSDDRFTQGYYSGVKFMEEISTLQNLTH